jgi:hypothetical protein
LGIKHGLEGVQNMLTLSITLLSSGTTILGEKMKGINGTNKLQTMQHNFSFVTLAVDKWQLKTLNYG